MLKFIPNEEQSAVLNFLAREESAELQLKKLISVEENQDVFAETVVLLVQEASLKYNKISPSNNEKEASRKSKEDHEDSDQTSYIENIKVVLPFLEIIGQLTTGGHMAKAIESMPAGIQQQMLYAIKIALHLPKTASLDELTEELLKQLIPWIKECIIGLKRYLVCYDNIKAWWRGEISGACCAINILDAWIPAIIGGMAGAYIGMRIWPGPEAAVGCLVVGALVKLGGVTLGGISKDIKDMVWNLFGNSKEVSLKQAYRFFGLPVTASNYEIAARFRELERKFHPENGGRTEDWWMLQNFHGIIEVSREKLA